MSTPRDITHRLRARARLYREHGAVSTADDMFEAAADIERLRGELRSLRNGGDAVPEREAPPLPLPPPRAQRGRIYRDFVDGLKSWVNR